MIYPRRDPAVLNCTDPYLIEIEMVTEKPCDMSGGACVWQGTFEARIYNIDPAFAVWDWDVSLGTINDDTSDIAVIEVLSSVSEIIDVMLTVTYDNGVDPVSVLTLTQEIETTVCNGACSG